MKPLDSTSRPGGRPKGRSQGKQQAGNGTQVTSPKPSDKSLWEQVKRTVAPLDSRQRALYSQALAEYLETTQPHPNQNHPARTPAGVHGAMKAHKPGHPAQIQPHPGPQATPAKAAPPRTALPARPTAPPLVDLDRRTRTRIARGTTPIDARIDLHGLRQHEAMDVLRAFIWRAQAMGHRTVLVITGKGARQRAPDPYAPSWAIGAGVLRQAVPGWLGAPDMRAAVLSVEPAHLSHGGEGALYVRLRSPRTSKPAKGR